MSSLKWEKLENLFLLALQNIIPFQHIVRVGVIFFCCLLFRRFTYFLCILICSSFLFAVGFSCFLSLMLLKRAYGRIQNGNVFFDECFVFEKIQTYAFVSSLALIYIYMYTFTIITFQMAYGFHFLSFRNDFQRCFPFILIHLHNSMHLETLMCMSLYEEKKERKKMKALYVSRWCILVTKN